MKPEDAQVRGNRPNDTTRLRTVIVAVSDDTSRASLLDMLTGTCWKASVVTNASAVIREAQRLQRSGCVVLASFNLNGSESKRLARRLATFPCGSNYLIFLVNHRDRGLVEKAYRAGASEVMVHPPGILEFRARMEHAWRFLELESLREEVGDNRTLIAEMSTATVVHSRNYLESELAKEVERSLRYGHSLGVILAEARMQFDPEEGTFRASGRHLRNLVRKDIDWVARYSQKSFALVLPETGVQSCIIAAQRLSRRMASIDIPQDEESADATWNFGVSALDKMPDAGTADATNLLTSAEEFLSAARLEGPYKVAGGSAIP